MDANNVLNFPFFYLGEKSQSLYSSKLSLVITKIIIELISKEAVKLAGKEKCLETGCSSMNDIYDKAERLGTFPTLHQL